jgi:hypothetical protein
VNRTASTSRGAVAHTTPWVASDGNSEAAAVAAHPHAVVRVTDAKWFEIDYKEKIGSGIALGRNTWRVGAAN